MTDNLVGKHVGGYEILEVIGHGGMATVYRAQQVSMNRTVAIKVLPSQYVTDDTYMQRFQREVEIAAKLEHRNIVPVHDYGQHEGQPYIIMRYMNGGSVDDLLRRGALDVDTILEIIEQIAPALDYAHSKNVLHRDLKPSNILLDDDGGAYLTDFGIARLIVEQQPGPTITAHGVVGTPSYMSPEQAQGHPLDNRSDIYSLGITVFEMATAQRPFQSDTPYSIAVMQVTTPPPSPRSMNPALSIAFEQVIYKALKKKREERYSTAASMAEAMRRALQAPLSSVHDTQPGFPRPATKPVPVRPTPEPLIVPPPAPQPRYTTPGGAPQVSRRRAKPRNLWMNAALGGLIGCGLLTIIVIIIAILISGGQVTGALDNGTRSLPVVTYTPDYSATNQAH